MSVRAPLVELMNVSGGDPFPCITNISQLFMTKGIRTVFVSIGNSPSSLTDLAIAEEIGCPLNVLCVSEEAANAWNLVTTCLKARKPLAESSPFSDGAHTKWVLPKNVRVNVLGDSASSLATSVKSICRAMSVSEEATRIDLLKIDFDGGVSRRVLYEILDAGFRPAVVMVRWDSSPDLNISVKSAAGHLQNCGYALIGKEGNKYLYFFVDNDMYSTCSWEIVGAVNPMVDNIVNEVLAQIQAAKEAAATAETVAETVIQP